MCLTGIDKLHCVIEKYRLLTEEEMKLFLENELKKPTSLLQKIKLDAELLRLLRNVPLTVNERNSLQLYCKSFLPLWYRIGLGCGECCLIFGITTLSYSVGKCIFSGILCLMKL
tara:strand:+ start:197 stop:538 length:342 start_codon:yes stop_codon:yes gene_type:complete